MKGVKRGKPEPGTGRPITTNEAISIGMASHERTEVRVDAEGRTSVWRSGATFPAFQFYHPGSTRVAELEQFWKLWGQRKRRLPADAPVFDEPAQPWRKVVDRRRAASGRGFGRGLVDVLECNHRVPVQPSSKSREYRQCDRCPAERGVTRRSPATRSR